MPNLDYLYVFAISSALELPVYEGFYRNVPVLRDTRTWRHWGKVAGLVILANLCTHSMAFFGFLSTGKPYLKAVLLAQFVSIVAEACLHSWAARISLRRTLVASLCANLFSWQFAPLVSYALFF
jgi:hypothetical protein